MARRSGSAPVRCHLPWRVLPRSKKGASASQSRHLLHVCSSEAALLEFPRCNCRIFRSHTVCTWTHCCQGTKHPHCLYTGRDPPCCKPCLKGECKALGMKKAAPATLHAGLAWGGTAPSPPTLSPLPTAATTQKGLRWRAVEDKAGTAGTAPLLPSLAFPMDCQPVWPRRGAAPVRHALRWQHPFAIVSQNLSFLRSIPINHSHGTGFPGLASPILKSLCSHGGTRCRT